MGDILTDMKRQMSCGRMDNLGLYLYLICCECDHTRNQNAFRSCVLDVYEIIEIYGRTRTWCLPYIELGRWLCSNFFQLETRLNFQKPITQKLYNVEQRIL